MYQRILPTMSHKKRNRTARVLKLSEIESLNLPLRQRDVREDGFIFKQYYVRINKDTGEESRVYEQWCSKESWKKQLADKASRIKINSDLNRQFVKRVKSIFGCSVCGYKKSLMALHFHHTGPKKNEVSKMFGYSRKSLKEEMRNCILVCSNCHCEIHENDQEKI